MEQTIRNLDDVAAERILRTIARACLHSGAVEIAWSPEVRSRLAQELDATPATVSVSAGELAREALLVLAEDPDTARAISTWTQSPSQALDRYDAGATIAITTAVLIALQTHIRIERDCTPSGLVGRIEGNC